VKKIHDVKFTLEGGETVTVQVNGEPENVEYIAAISRVQGFRVGDEHYPPSVIEDFTISEAVQKTRFSIELCEHQVEAACGLWLSDSLLDSPSPMGNRCEVCGHEAKLTKEEDHARA